MRTDTDFSGLWIPLVTPFQRGKLDLLALSRLVQRLRSAGVAGVVACGSTGEAAALEKSEQLEVLATVLRAAPGLPVVMGVAGHNLEQTAARLRELSALPIAALLVPAPLYIRPSQAGLLQWFRTLADQSEVPLMIYDIPYRTGVQLERKTVLELAQHPGIQAIKDCGGDAGKTLALIAQAKLQVLCGEDLQIFSTVAQGGVGAIAASAHVGTTHFVELLRLLGDGELGPARKLWRALAPWIEAAFAEPNPAPVKAMLARRGEIHNELRPPMTTCSQDFAARLAEFDTNVA